MEKYGFIYIWYDRKRKMYYIGSHWGTEGDGYICSSNRMRDAYRRRPNDFKRRIIEKVTTDRKDLLEAEEKWLKRAEPHKKKYYNVNFFVVRYSDQVEEVRKKKIGLATKGKSYEERYGPSKAKEVKKKLSKSLKGKPIPAHHKKILSELRLGKTYREIYGRKKAEEILLKVRGRTYEEIHGKEKANELKIQMSIRVSGNNHPMYGKKHTTEAKNKMSQVKKGKIPWNKGMSGIYNGENNYAYGKSWYNNGRECKRFFVIDVPSGWSKGILRKKEKFNED